MNPEYAHINRFDRFLYGELSAEELAQFEHDLASNPELKMEFEAYKLAHEVVLEKELGGLKNQISSDLDQLLTPPTDNTKGWWSLGVFIAIVTVGVVVFMQDNKTKAPASPSNTEVIPTKTEKVTKQQVEPTKQQISVSEPQLTPVVTSEKNIEKKVSPIKYEVTETSNKSIQNESENKIKEPIEPILITQKNTSSTEESKALIDSCSIKKSSFKITVRNTAFDANTGFASVQTNSITGAKGNPLFALNDNRYSSNYTFSNLEAGTYQVKMKDAEGCVTIQEIEIGKTVCLENYTKTFSPEYDSEWLVPTNTETGVACLFKLVNKKGEPVFQQTIGAYENLYWSGNGFNNEILASDYYRFVITYNTGEECVGDITLIK